MKSILDKLGLYLLFLIISVIPFHFWASDFGIFVFYREIIAIGFFILLISNLLLHRHLSLRIRKELFFIILFPILLCIAALYDPMINLYSRGSLENITNDTLTLDPRIYVLRNSFLYLPMVLYFSNRGITENEIKQIAIISVAIAPFSILFYLLNILEESAFSIFLLGEMSEIGGGVIEYNSYVPYLSFPVTSGIFLLLDRQSMALKLLILLSITIVSIFVFLSSSRQTLLLIAIVLLSFLLLDQSSKKTTKIIMFSLVAFVIFGAYEFIMSGYDLNERLMQKYSGGPNYRFETMSDGLNRLGFLDYIKGAGLTSVLVSGPHNDYIRWTQRVGLFIMIIGFIPYFSAAYKCFIKTLNDRNDTVTCYIGLAIFYIIYHSVFGYPREDAYQAVWSFLGITLWLGYTKNNKDSIFSNKRSTKVVSAI